VLRDDVRNGIEADVTDMRSVASRARTVAGALLLSALHQNEPHFAYIQPRSEGDGEATKLHQSAVSAGNLLLPGPGPAPNIGALLRSFNKS